MFTLSFDADALVSLSTGATKPVSFSAEGATPNAAVENGMRVARLNGWTVRGWAPELRPLSYTVSACQTCGNMDSRFRVNGSCSLCVSR